MLNEEVCCNLIVKLQNINSGFTEIALNVYRLHCAILSSCGTLNALQKTAQFSIIFKNRKRLNWFTAAPTLGLLES